MDLKIIKKKGGQLFIGKDPFAKSEQFPLAGNIFRFFNEAISSFNIKCYQAGT